jgi:hypothetical protein
MRLGFPVEARTHVAVTFPASRLQPLLEKYSRCYNLTDENWLMAQGGLGYDRARDVYRYRPSLSEVVQDRGRDAVPKPMRLPVKRESASVTSSGERVLIEHLVVLADSGSAGDDAAREDEALVSCEARACQRQERILSGPAWAYHQNQRATLLVHRAG